MHISYTLMVKEWVSSHSGEREIKMIKIIKIVCGSEIPLLETVLREHKYKRKDFSEQGIC